MTTFYVIRSIKEFSGYNTCPVGSKENLYSFLKGWYAARKYVRPFEEVKFFNSIGKASAFLKNSLCYLDFNEYFEIVPIEITEPNKDKKPIYKVGDFVMYYEGMGVGWYGTIVKIGRNFEIHTWTPDNNKYPSYKTTVTITDMRGLSSPEQAMEYYLITSGQK